MELLQILAIILIIVSVLNTFLLFKMIRRKNNLELKEDNKTYFSLKFRIDLMATAATFIVATIALLGYNKMENISASLKQELDKELVEARNKIAQDLESVKKSDSLARATIKNLKAFTDVNGELLSTFESRIINANLNLNKLKAEQGKLSAKIKKAQPFYYFNRIPLVKERDTYYSTITWKKLREINPSLPIFKKKPTAILFSIIEEDEATVLTLWTKSLLQKMLLKYLHHQLTLKFIIL